MVYNDDNIQHISRGRLLSAVDLGTVSDDLFTHGRATDHSILLHLKKKYFYYGVRE
jgi:hypothetical protein